MDRVFIKKVGVNSLEGINISIGVGVGVGVGIISKEVVCRK